MEVFKTNVDDPELADEILAHLRKQFPEARITFALDDCDRILRMAGDGVDPLRVEESVRSLGFQCQTLED